MAVDQSSRHVTKNRLDQQDERLYLGMFKYNHLNTIFLNTEPRFRFTHKKGP